MESIYEQNFLLDSYGYRPRIGATNALEDLYQELRNRQYHYIVEANIKGYFDNIYHEILLDMLRGGEKMVKIAEFSFVTH